MCKIKHNPRQNQEKFQGIHKRIPFSLYFLVLFGLLPFYPFTFKSLPCLLLVQFYQAVEFKVGFDFIQYPLYDDIHHASFAVVGRRQHYTGGGILLRRDLDSGLYYEGAVRAGYLKGDFHGMIAKSMSRYDSGAPYIAAQAGLGKIYTRNRDSYDIYGKFF